MIIKIENSGWRCSIVGRVLACMENLGSTLTDITRNNLSPWDVGRRYQKFKVILWLLGPDPLLCSETRVREALLYLMEP